MRRVAVVGAHGQLGRDICARLSADVVHALSRADADLTDGSAVQACLRALQPTAVINCAAYNLVDKAETEPALAFAVNAFAPRTLAQVCAELDVPLLHFSTDYVFGHAATRREPWEPTDAPGPVSVYGASKLAGEHLIRATWAKSFVVRTCGLYGVWGAGGKGGNFVETMLRVAAQGKPLRVVADQICTPSYTADVASAALALLSTDSYGLYHITNAGHCSWHELAAAIFAEAGVTANLTPITTAEYGAPARRPAYSVLSGASLTATGVPALRPWRAALQAYLRERTTR
jgi:dTDP-4-dehydrorhamnose reductase